MPFEAEGYNCDIDGEFVPYTQEVDKVDNLLCVKFSKRNPKLLKEEIIKIADNKINTIEFTDEDYKTIVNISKQLDKYKL